MIVLISPAGSYRTSVYIAAAERQSIPLIFVTDGEPDLVRSDISGLKVDLSNSVIASKEIVERLNGNSVDAVIGTDDKVVEIANRVSRALNLPHNPISAVRATHSKELARQALQHSELNTPKFVVVDVDNYSERELEMLSFPCVAKPISLSASRGVIRADNFKELKQALRRIKEILIKEYGTGQTFKALIEDYVPGTEHALEGYLSSRKLETICLFDKPDPLEGPYFEETYYVTPSRLSASVQNEIASVIDKTCNILGLTVGPIHAEVRVDGEQIWVLEIAARTIGGDCARLFELATNTGLEEYILCKAAGKRTSTIELNQAAGVLMIPVPSNGIVRRVEGVTNAQAVEHVLEIRLNVREGQMLTMWPEGDLYPGFLFARGESPEQVENALRTAHSHLKIVTMPIIPALVAPEIQNSD